MNKLFVIKDVNEESYYRLRSNNSWYSKDIRYARFYVDEKAARRTIDAGDHHVSYPGNRQLDVVAVEVKEI